MFEYFNANENEQYLFLQLPLMLIKDDTFKSLSGDSKILYSLLLNRTALSTKNNWIDEAGHVYIIYTIDQICEDLNCWEQKAIKSMKELKDIGLVKSVRRGLGKPNILYVMNFATALKYQADVKQPEKPENTLNCDFHNSGTVKITIQELPESQFKNCENHNVGILTLSKTDLTNNDYKSESMSTSEKTETGKTSNRHDDKNDFDNDFEILESNKRKAKEPPVSNASQSTETESPSKHIGNSSISYDYSTYRLKLQENIEYSYYLANRSSDLDLIDELMNCMLDVICTPGDTVKIGKENKPRQMVIDSYLKINSLHIDHVLERYKEQQHKITHLHAYLKTMLFTTMQEQGHYYTNAVRVDGII